jgi:hypothetical protein
MNSTVSDVFVLGVVCDEIVVMLLPGVSNSRSPPARLLARQPIITSQFQYIKLETRNNCLSQLGSASQDFAVETNSVWRPNEIFATLRHVEPNGQLNSVVVMFGDRTTADLEPFDVDDWIQPPDRSTVTTHRLPRSLIRLISRCLCVS